MLFVETLLVMTLMMMGTEAAPVIVPVVIVSGSISIGLLIIIIPLRSDWICSLKLFLLLIISFGSLIRIRGLSLFSVLFFVLFLFLVLLLFLLLFLLVLPFLTTFLLLLTARILLHGVSVQLEQLSRIEIREIGHKKPQRTSPISALILRHVVNDRVNVLPNLDKAPSCVGNLLFWCLVWIWFVQSFQTLLDSPHLFLALSKCFLIQICLEIELVARSDVDRTSWSLGLGFLLALVVLLLGFLILLFLFIIRTIVILNNLFAFELFLLLISFFSFLGRRRLFLLGRRWRFIPFCRLLLETSQQISSPNIQMLFLRFTTGIEKNVSAKFQRFIRLDCLPRSKTINVDSNQKFTVLVISPGNVKVSILQMHVQPPILSGLGFLRHNFTKRPQKRFCFYQSFGIYRDLPNLDTFRLFVGVGILLQSLFAFLPQKSSKIHKIGRRFVCQFRIFPNIFHPCQRHRKLFVAFDESSNLRICEAVDFVFLFLLDGLVVVSFALIFIIRISFPLVFILLIFSAQNCFSLSWTKIKFCKFFLSFLLLKLFSNIGWNNFVPKLLNSARFSRSNRRIFINRETGNFETRHEIIVVIIVLIFSSSLCSSQDLINITGRFISLFLLVLFKQLFSTKFKNGIKLIFAERLSFRGPSITSFQNR